MRPRLINFAFSANVLLLVLVSLAWAISYTVGYTGVLLRGAGAVVLDTCLGEVSLWYTPVAPASTQPSAQPIAEPIFSRQMVYDRNVAATTDEWFRASKGDKSGLIVLSLGYIRVSDMIDPIGNRLPPGRSARAVVFPYWVVVALLAMWPIRRAWRELRTKRELRRQLQGLCPRCGYDMRFTPDRCPECGLKLSALPPVSRVAWSAEASERRRALSGEDVQEDDGISDRLKT